MTILGKCPTEIFDYHYYHMPILEYLILSHVSLLHKREDYSDVQNIEASNGNCQRPSCPVCINIVKTFSSLRRCSCHVTALKKVCIYLTCFSQWGEREKKKFSEGNA